MSTKMKVQVSLLKQIIELLVHLDTSRLNPELQYEFEQTIRALSSKKYRFLLRFAYLAKSHDNACLWDNAFPPQPSDSDCSFMSQDDPPF